jgi:hypothetical protein
MKIFPLNKLYQLLSKIYIKYKKIYNYLAREEAERKA